MLSRGSSGLGDQVLKRLQSPTPLWRPHSSIPIADILTIASCDGLVQQPNHIGLPCPYCGRPMHKPTRAHIRPVIYGGSLRDQNKVAVCEPCNHDKGHHTLTDWARHLLRDGDPRAATVAAYRTARRQRRRQKGRRLYEHRRTSGQNHRPYRRPDVRGRPRVYC